MFISIYAASTYFLIYTNLGAYQVVGGGVLSDKNSALSLNKVQEVWYQSFIFENILLELRTFALFKLAILFWGIYKLK